METRVRLEPWSDGDFWLLERKNEPVMTEHLSGPESAEKLADRQRRYEALSAREPAAGRMFRVVLEPSGESVGSVDFEYPPGVPHPSCDWRYRVGPQDGITLPG